jgi:hypothetical protein
VKTWLLSVMAAVFILTVGYGGYRLGIRVEQTQADKEFRRLHEQNQALQAEVQSLQAQVLVQQKEKEAAAAQRSEASGVSFTDRDAILDFLQPIDDFISLDYTQEQLAAFQTDPANKDYRHVLRQFVQQELKKELDTFQTIGKEVNPRWVMVTTRDGMVYQIALQRWYTHDGIWLVKQYKEMQWDDTREPWNRYRILTLADAPEDVREWASKWLTDTEPRTEYLSKGEHVYLLIKSSKSPTDSVELEDVRWFAGELTVFYQTFDYRQDREAGPLINDYLLLEVPFSGEGRITFENTPSVVR